MREEGTVAPARDTMRYGMVAQHAIYAVEAYSRKKEKMVLSREVWTKAAMGMEGVR